MSTRASIVITDSDFGDDDVEREVLADVGDITLAQARTVSAVIAAAAGADALLVQWAPIDAEVLEALSGLKIVVRYGIGLDNIDLDAAAERGVEVRNVDDYCLDEVADHAAAAIAAASRGLFAYDRAAKSGAWGPSVAPSPLPPEQDPVGIAGYGRIGRRVAQRMARAGHPIVVWDSYAADLARRDGHAVADSLVELAERVRHLSLHIPSTPETAGVVGEAVLRALGSRGHVVNAARGALLDEPAVLAWLEANPDAAASLDVFVVEPPSAISERLCRHPQVAASPHVAYLSTESLPRLRRTAATHVREALTRVAS